MSSAGGLQVAGNMISFRLSPRFCYFRFSPINKLNLTQLIRKSVFVCLSCNNASLQYILNCWKACSCTFQMVPHLPRSRTAARRPAMTALHCQAHLRWCRQHLLWNSNMWRNIMFSDESRFCQKMCRTFADCCTDRVTCLGGGSVMVWDGISLSGRTRLLIFSSLEVHVLFHQTSIIQSTKQLQTTVNSKIQLFGIDRGNLSHFSWVQPTYSALLLIPQMHVPHKWGTI